MDNLAKNIYVNVTTIGSTLGLSFMSLMERIEGFLPTASLFLSTGAMCVLIYLHLKNASKAKAEERLATLRADTLELELSLKYNDMVRK